jgi:AcrR family transcriptional regulator
MAGRTRDPERMRAALLDAGLRVAERTGLGWLTLDQVVAEAKVAKGSLLHHFRDRAGYLLALHRRFHDRLLEDIRKASDGLPPGRERLLRDAVTYLDACLRHRGVRALLLEARAEPQIAAEVLARNAQIARRVEPDVRALGWPDPAESARLWVAMVAEAALVEFAAGGRRAAVRRALEHFLDAGRTRRGR